MARKTNGGLILPDHIATDVHDLPAKEICFDIQRQLMSHLATPLVEVGLQIVLPNLPKCAYAFSFDNAFNRWALMMQIANKIQKDQPGGSRKFVLPGTH